VEAISVNTSEAFRLNNFEPTDLGRSLNRCQSQLLTGKDNYVRRLHFFEVFLTGPIQVSTKQSLSRFPGSLIIVTSSSKCGL
jgi:hypothetical protein